MSAKEVFEFLDAKVRIDKIPSIGRTLKICANPEQLTKIAKICRVSSLDRLSAQILVSPFKRGFQVTGQLEANVAQPCVVTLEPVSQNINEPLNRIFLPGPDVNAEAAAGSEKFIDLEDDDIPDHFDGAELDLSGYLMEILGLAIDLYPRSPGAEMEAQQAGDDPARLSPFAVLNSLDTAKKSDN